MSTAFHNPYESTETWCANCNEVIRGVSFWVVDEWWCEDCKEKREIEREEDECNQ